MNRDILKKNQVTQHHPHPIPNTLKDQGWIFPESKEVIFCALCSKPRPLRLKSAKLQLINYCQLVILNSFVTLILSVWLPWGPSFILGGIFWLIIFDLGKRSVYRHLIKCPYCGFDALLYRRDSVLAKKKIQEHIQRLTSN